MEIQNIRTHEDSSDGYKYTLISIKEEVSFWLLQKHIIHKYSQFYSKEGTYSHARGFLAGTTLMLLTR